MRMTVSPMATCEGLVGGIGLVQQPGPGSGERSATLRHPVRNAGSSRVRHVRHHDVEHVDVFQPADRRLAVRLNHHFDRHLQVLECNVQPAQLGAIGPCPVKENVGGLGVQHRDCPTARLHHAGCDDVLEAAELVECTAHGGVRATVGVDVVAAVGGSTMPVSGVHENRQAEGTRKGCEGARVAAGRRLEIEHAAGSNGLLLDAERGGGTARKDREM